jgi:hypothetical protein
LQKALADVAQKNDAQLKVLAQQHTDQLREMRSAYDIRIDQISAAYNQRLAEKDQTISELLRELRKAHAAGPSIVPRDATPTVEETSPLQPEAPADETPAEPDVVTKAQAIRERLSPEENGQLQQLLTTASPETVAFAEAQIANMSADDAVAYLREHVLAAPNAA